MSEMDAFTLRMQIQALHDRAVLAHDCGQYADAEKLFEQTCDLARDIDDLNLLVLLRCNLIAVQRPLGRNQEVLTGLTWVIGLTNDHESTRQLNEESLRCLAGAFASLSDAARKLPGSSLDDLLRMLRGAEAWIGRIGKPIEWSADLRIQRGLILDQRGEKRAARQEMETSLALKRRQRPTFGFTLETHVFQLADLIKDEPFEEYDSATVLASEILDSPDRTYVGALRAYRIRSVCRQRLGDLEGAEHDAREMVALAKLGDSKRERIDALSILGWILGVRNERPEAAIAYREAFELLDEDDTQFVSVANSYAWQNYLLGSSLDEAAEVARRAWEKDRGNAHVLQTLAAILVRQDRWDDAAALVRDWASRINREYLSSQWGDDLLLFKDALKYGRAEALAGLLNQDLWEPMRLALIKAAHGDEDTSDLPTRLRDAVRTLLAQLRGAGVRLAYPMLEGDGAGGVSKE